MASPPMYHRVTCLKDVKSLVAAHPGEKLWLWFGDQIERISEARGLENLLEKEEEGWIVERGAALKRFVDIDRTIGDTHGLLVYLIEITAPHAADRSASSSTSPAKKGGGSSNLSTSLSSPDYGTGEFAKRVADKLNLAGLRSISPARRSASTARGSSSIFSATRAAAAISSHDYGTALRSVSAGRGCSSNLSSGTSRIGLSASAERLRADSKSKSSATDLRADLVRGNSTDLRADLVRGNSNSSGVRADRPLRLHLSREAHQVGRPAGRFVTPVNAERVMQMGNKLKEMPLQSIRDAGELVTDLGFRLTIDEELAVDLFEALKKAKKLVVKCWNAGASLPERSPVVKDEMPEVAKP